MPTRQSTFNSNGHATRAPKAPKDSTGFSAVATSPYRSDGTAWQEGAKNVEADPSVPHMGFVTSPERRDDKGRMIHKSERFRIRIACEHWSLDGVSDDCRYGCEAKAQVAAFVP